MRRPLALLALVPCLTALGFRPSPAAADAGHTGICVFTTYTVTGSFTLIPGPGAAQFNVFATGSCTGTTTSVTVSIDYTSIGPWSCDGGVAHGTGSITANNISPIVDSYLVNVGGEYVIELHSTSSGTVAAGEFTTLPMPCDQRQTQATITGPGALTFTA